MVFRLLAGLVIAYAAFLRFDAVTLIHGPVQSPAWLGAIQSTRPAVSAWRPGPMTWERWEGRYISDPYTYLQYAREPRGFYDAHRREPAFVFATRFSLWLFNNQDVAVSWASAFFSVLSVLGTFVLGRRAFSPTVGLLAATGLAIEMEVITWSVGGWRDDAFMCAVILTAHGVLRLRDSPTRANAAWLGVVTAAACLIRITSLSFVLPALGLLWWLLPLPRVDRLRRMAVAGLVVTVLFAPYLINCWRVFGDPLYAINVHADIYREAEGQAVQASQTASEYLASEWKTRPMTTLDTAILGMTTYPFTNKWDGFNVWHPWLRTVLPIAALLGLVGFLGSAAGRLLLALLAASLIPYALTWKLIGDWRFTEHAYPVFLLAAAWTITGLARVATPTWWATVRQRGWPTRRVVGAWAAALSIIAVVTWTSISVLPARAGFESLRLDGTTTITAGARGAAFFTRGWGLPVTQGNVTARLSTSTTATLRLPTVPGQAYDLLLRMDPFPAPSGEGPLPNVRLFADGLPAGRVQLTWNPERIGTYLVPMPVATREWTDLQFMVDRNEAGPDRLRVWWVQVRLRQAHRPSSP